MVINSNFLFSMDFFFLCARGKKIVSLVMFYLVGNRNFLEWFSDYFCHFLQQFEINTVGGKKKSYFISQMCEDINSSMFFFSSCDAGRRVSPCCISCSCPCSSCAEGTRLVTLTARRAQHHSSDLSGIIQHSNQVKRWTWYLCRAGEGDLQLSSGGSQHFPT